MTVANKSFRSELERAAWKKAESLVEIHWDGLVKRGVSTAMAQRYVRRWAKLGWIVQNGKEGHRKTYRLAGQPENVAQGVSTKCRTAEDAMWIVMVRHRTFTEADLVGIGSVGTVAVTASDAKRYCKNLVRAGYLRIHQAAVFGKRPAVYRLIKNTGVLAPVSRRYTGLYDPNEGTFDPFSDEVQS